MTSELKKRLIVGPSLALIALSTVALDIYLQVPYGVLTLLVIGVIAASLEYAQLVRPVAAGVQRVSLACVATILVLGPWLSSSGLIPLPDQVPIQGLILGLGFIWVGLRQFQRYGVDHFIHNVGATLMGMCYLGLLPGMLAGVVLVGTENYPERGHVLFVLVVAAVKLGDVAAFFGGRAFGRHKMAPAVSPGKTWEGFASSLLGSVGGTYAFVAIAVAVGLGNPFGGWWQPMIWGAVLGPVGVLGDLFESGLKRHSAVKDSGSTIPGFGGVLDVFDAILLAGPPAFLLAFLLD